MKTFRRVPSEPQLDRAVEELLKEIDAEGQETFLNPVYAGGQERDRRIMNRRLNVA